MAAQCGKDGTDGDGPTRERSSGRPDRRNQLGKSGSVQVNLEPVRFTWDQVGSPGTSQVDACPLHPSLPLWQSLLAPKHSSAQCI